MLVFVVGGAGGSGRVEQCCWLRLSVCVVMRVCVLVFVRVCVFGDPLIPLSYFE